MSNHSVKSLFLLMSVICATAAVAQGPAPYGLPVSLETAKKASAAIAEARKNNWNMAVAIVDPSGTLVYYEKMDNTQVGSAQFSIKKANSAALFKPPTNVSRTALLPATLDWLCLPWKERLTCVIYTRVR
jgi:glc operon protein GlcG